MITSGRAAGVALVITLAVLAPGAALAQEGPLAVVAGNGRVVIANGDPGCPVTVSADGFSGASVLDANGIAVVDAALAEGTAVAASSAGAGCRTEHAVGVVDNDQVLAEAAASARTGADTVLGLIAAVGAAGIGTALVVAARRKKA
jgi:hypothetical protein